MTKNINYARRRARARMASMPSSNTFGIGPFNHNPLKLRREPDEFFVEPRKQHKNVSLPKLKCLEGPDP